MRSNLVSMVLASVLVAPIALSEESLPPFQIGSSTAQVLGFTLIVPNLRRSVDFYTRVLGMKEFAIPGVPTPDIDDPQAVGKIMLNFSGSHADPSIGLLKVKGDTPNQSASERICINLKVKDVAATFERIRSAGAPVLREPTKSRGATSVVIRDPDGYCVELLEAPIVANPATAN